MAFLFCALSAAICSSLVPEPMSCEARRGPGACGPHALFCVFENSSLRKLFSDFFVRAGLSLVSAAASPLSRSDAMFCKVLQELPHRPAKGDSFPCRRCLPVASALPRLEVPLLPFCVLPWLEVLGSRSFGIGLTARLSNGEGTGDAIRVVGAVAGS